MSFESDLERIQLQEQTLHFHQFGADHAWDMGVRLRDMALKRRLPLVVDVRRFGQPLFYAAMEGTTPDNVEWVRRKTNLVARFHRSSYGMGLMLKQQNTTLLDKFGLSLADFAAHGGAFPLHLEGTGVIGSITVSGLPQREDHELVVEAICAELGRNYADLALPA